MNADGGDQDAITTKSSAGAADDSEGIDFCRQMPTPPMPSPDWILGRDQRPSQKGLAYGLFAFFVLGVSLSIYFRLGSFWGLIFACVVVGTPMALIAGYRIRGWLLDRRMAAAGVAATPSVGARLRCRGDIHQILADGPIQDVSFEPRVFRAMIKDSAAIRIGGLLYGVTAMPQLLMVPGPWNGLTASLWGVCALFGAIYLLRPMYYRIVPGRLDVLRYSLLRRAPMRVERHDLRAAQVWIDMRTNLVSIIEGDKVSEYALWFMRERNAFARALFEGAISTHAAPATSDEVL